MRLAPPALALALLALACGPAVPDATFLTLSFERDDPRGDELRAVELDVTGAIVYLGDSPGDPRARAACDAQGGIRRDLAASVVVDLTSGGRTLIGSVSVPDDAVRPLHEIRLLARPPAVRARMQRLAAAGRLTCVDGDGEHVVLRLQPEAAIALRVRADHALLAEFHNQGDVAREGSRLLVGQHYPLTLER